MSSARIGWATSTSGAVRSTRSPHCWQVALVGGLGWPDGHVRAGTVTVPSGRCGTGSASSGSTSAAAARSAPGAPRPMLSSIQSPPVTMSSSADRPAGAGSGAGSGKTAGSGSVGLTGSATTGATSAATRPGVAVRRNPPARTTPSPTSVPAAGGVPATTSTGAVPATPCSTHVRDVAPESRGSDGASVSTSTAPMTTTCRSPAHVTRANAGTSSAAPTTAPVTAARVDSASGASTNAASRESGRDGSGDHRSAPERHASHPSPGATSTVDIARCNLLPPAQPAMGTSPLPEINFSSVFSGHG